MITSNPETVSTDYDTSSRLYFEPLAAEDVLAVCRAEQPFGVIAQFGGQTPLQLATTLQEEGFAILGTSPAAIDLAEDRGKFAEILRELEIPAPPHGEARTMPEARAIAEQIGYPVVVRPSYVLGGRAMEIVYDDDDRAVRPNGGRCVAGPPRADRPLPRRCDRGRRRRGVGRTRRRLRGRGMEHIEEAGVHSGDSSCQIPPATLSDDELDTIEDIAVRLARRLGVVGLMNLQLAVKDERIGCWRRTREPRARCVRLKGVHRCVVGVDRHAVLTGRTIADLRVDGVLPEDPHHYRRLPTRVSRRPCCRSVASQERTRYWDRR
jgi:carbamoyl-phosphate synthase large subunit